MWLCLAGIGIKKVFRLERFKKCHSREKAQKAQKSWVSFVFFVHYSGHSILEIALEPVMNLGEAFVGFKTGCRQGVASAHPRNGAESEPQRRRQPVFNPTLRAGRLLAISRVARPDKIHKDIAASLAPWKSPKSSPANVSPKFMTGSKLWLASARPVPRGYPHARRAFLVNNGALVGLGSASI